MSDLESKLKAAVDLLNDHPDRFALDRYKHRLLMSPPPPTTEEMANAVRLVVALWDPASDPAWNAVEVLRRWLAAVERRTP